MLDRPTIWLDRRHDLSSPAQRRPLLTAATLQPTVRFLSRTVAYGYEAGDPRLDLRRHAQRRLATAPHARRGRSG